MLTDRLGGRGPFGVLPIVSRKHLGGSRLQKHGREMREEECRIRRALTQCVSFNFDTNFLPVAKVVIIIPGTKVVVWSGTPACPLRTLYPKSKHLGGSRLQKHIEREEECRMRRALTQYVSFTHSLVSDTIF